MVGSSAKGHVNHLILLFGMCVNAVIIVATYSRIRSKLAHSFEKSRRSLKRRGNNALEEICELVDPSRVGIVMDVGANVGQYTVMYLKYFPQAKVYCFEPAGHTFAKLSQRFYDEPRVSLRQCALGSTQRRGVLVNTDNPKTYHLLEHNLGEGVDQTEDVAVTTLDNICVDFRIERIHYLKIDSEGADLEVLLGARGLLKDHRIDVIELEAGINPGNALHVPLEKLKSHLESFDYYLFGVYEQTAGTFESIPYLERINPLFISTSLGEQASRVH